MDKVTELRGKLSDANLMLLPEYEQRVRVLQEVRGRCCSCEDVINGTAHMNTPPPLVLV